MDLDDLQARAAQLRADVNVSQAAMARYCGCSQNTLRLWELGEIKTPGLSNPAAAQRWYQVLNFLALTAPAGPAG